MPVKKKATRKMPRRKPESLRLRHIEPSLTVGDLQRSMRWYCDVVGFTLDEQWERDGQLRGVSLKAGRVHLNLSQDDWARGRDRVKGEGFRLYLNTAQDVDRLAADIRSRGGTLASQPADMPWGSRTFNLVDPDGFKLTIASTT